MKKVTSKDGTRIAFERSGAGPAIILVAHHAAAVHGEKTDARLQKAVRAVKAVPGAQLRTLKGQTHNVKPEVLSAALLEFFAAEHASGSDPEARRCGS